MCDEIWWTVKLENNLSCVCQYSVFLIPRAFRGGKMFEFWQSRNEFVSVLTSRVYGLPVVKWKLETE